MPNPNKNYIIKTCPSCSDTNLSVLRGHAESYYGRNAQGIPLSAKIERGLPTQSVAKCRVCFATSTWNLVQTDLSSPDIDYTEQT